jgi:hypothetical protein
MKAYNLLAPALFTLALSLSTQAFGVETKTEKAEAMGNKTADAVTRTYRNAKNEICEMINGKEKCVVKKVVNELKNTTDKLETNVEEMKNKAD